MALTTMKKRGTKKRGRGRPRGLGESPVDFKDRFQKFYYQHRKRLNDERRKVYNAKKRKGICVRCNKKAIKGSVFCKEHREKSRQYNRKE